MEMKNYELLGLKIPLTGDIRLKQLAEEREKIAGVPRVKHWIHQIENLLIYPCWKHMGIIDVPDVTAELEEGLALVVEYFHGDWWTAENIRRVESESPELLRLNKWTSAERVIEDNAGYMDRSPDGLFEWRNELRSGITFGGLLGKWNEVARICSALDANVPLEYSAGTIIDEYFQWYLCVAGRLSGQWTEGMETLLASVKKCRQKRLRLVVKAWEAALAHDQGAFDKTFPEAVKSFVKRESDPSEFQGVALDETVIWLIASQHGLSFPDMPDKLKAAVMTRESLGLEAAS